jgi:hypothetical protein
MAASIICGRRTRFAESAEDPRRRSVQEVSWEVTSEVALKVGTVCARRGIARGGNPMLAPKYKPVGVLTAYRMHGLPRGAAVPVGAGFRTARRGDNHAIWFFVSMINAESRVYGRAKGRDRRVVYAWDLQHDPVRLDIRSRGNDDKGAHDENDLREAAKDLHRWRPVSEDQHTPELSARSQMVRQRRFKNWRPFARAARGTSTTASADEKSSSAA